VFVLVAWGVTVGLPAGRTGADDGASVTSVAAAPGWKILVLVYTATDFTFTNESGTHRVVNTMSSEDLQAATDAATAFVTEDIPALDSGLMTPTVEVRAPQRTLTELEPYLGGWWVSPRIAGADRDPSFDAVIAIWDPWVTDLSSGQKIWIGPAEGLTPHMGTGQTYTWIQLDGAIRRGHRNVFKHEFGHSLLTYHDAAGTAPKPSVNSHTDATTYVNCDTGEFYDWRDETLAQPIPNSVYNSQSGFTHDYYSGTTALASAPDTCLGITPAAWASGGPVSKPPRPTLSINDVSVVEGDAGQTTATLVVTMSEPASGDVTLRYSTGYDWDPGFAQPPADFTAVEWATITIPAGTVTGHAEVQIIGDTSGEPDESFHIYIFDAVNADIADAYGGVTILNDDVPNVSIGDTEVAEGNAGVTTMTFPLTLDIPSAVDITLRWRTRNGVTPSTAGLDDYVPASGSVTIPAAATTGHIDISVVGDLSSERHEDIAVELVPIGDTAIVPDPIGLGTVVNDDGFSVTDATVVEGGAGVTTMRFTVTASSPLPAPASVNFATRDGSARAGIDYVAKSGKVSFAAGQTSADILVEVKGDTQPEPDQYFELVLAESATQHPLDAVGVGTIVNDDGPFPTALLIVGNPASLPTGDRPLLALLQDDGYDVSLLDDDELTGQYWGPLPEADVAVISSSVDPDYVSSPGGYFTWTSEVVPVVSLEGYAFQHLGLSDGAPGSQGETAALRSLRITDPTHPIAAGLTGTPTVAVAPTPFNFARPLGGHVVAVNPTASWQALITAWEAGEQASSRRVALFPSYSTPGKLNANGRALVAAAVRWATDTPPSPERVAVLIAGSSNPPSGDRAVRDRLEAAGLTVRVVDDDSATVDLDDAVMVVISSSVVPSKVGGRFTHVPLPVVTWEPYLYDDMLMSAAGSAENTTASSTINVVDAGDPLAAGLTGTVAVTTAAYPLSFGRPGPGARVVAAVPGRPDRATVFAYDAGSPLVDGSLAPELRIALFPSYSGASHLTPRGLAIVDAAIGLATSSG
jgi:hypothetical protein